MEPGIEEGDVPEITSRSMREAEPRLQQLFEKLMSGIVDEKSLIRVGTSGFRGRSGERLVRKISENDIRFLKSKKSTLSFSVMDKVPHNI